MNKILLKEKLLTLLKEKGYNHIGKSLKSYQNKLLYNELLKYTSFLDKNIRITEKLYCFFNNILERQKCIECQINPVTYNNRKKEYRKYCSIKCSNKSIEAKNKRKQTMVKNHGVEYTFKSKIFLEQRKETYLHKYGKDNPLKSKIILNKRNITNIKKYGHINPMSNKTIQLKVKSTNNNRYNVDYGLQNKSIRKKVKQTFIKNREGGINNILNNTLNRFNTNKFNLSFSYINGQYNCLCKKCNKVSYPTYTFIANRLLYYNITACIYCHSKNSSISRMEKWIYDYIKYIYEGEIEQSNRTILNGKEIDILLIDVNLGIEINGLYWHSSKYKKDKYYHLAKTENANKKNITLLHFFEDEGEVALKCIYKFLSRINKIKKNINIDLLYTKYKINLSKIDNIVYTKNNISKNNFHCKIYNKNNIIYEVIFNIKQIHANYILINIGLEYIYNISTTNYLKTALKELKKYITIKYPGSNIKVLKSINLMHYDMIFNTYTDIGFKLLNKTDISYDYLYKGKRYMNKNLIDSKEKDNIYKIYNSGYGIYSVTL